MRTNIVLILLICGLVILAAFAGCAKQPQKTKKSPIPPVKTQPSGTAEQPPTPTPEPGEPVVAPAPQPAPAPAKPIHIKMAAQSSLDPGTAGLAAEAYVAGTKATGAAAAGGRTKVRQLYSFEDSETYEIDGKPIPYLMKGADSVDAVYVQDNGATHGKWCARTTIEAGKSWGTFVLKDPEFLKGWSEYDYFAMDLFIDDDHPYRIVFELWDQDSKNYHTRCTFENNGTRKGQQTLMWPINQAKRNNKEGREWSELEPKDKIAMDNLKFIKIFTTPRKDRRMQFWIDNLRLLQEDAAKPKMNVDLPSSARAWDFGSPGACVPGFGAAGKDAVQGKGINAGGKGWPDLLAGTFVRAGHNEELTWSAEVTDGEYQYWLCAGMILPDQFRSPKYMLKLGNQTIHDESPSFEKYDSPAYVHRFQWTQYSERRHALWLDYISRMYPVHTGTVEIVGGKLSLNAVNYFVSGLILVPSREADDFKRMQAKLTKTRLEMFERLMHLTNKPPEPPEQANGYAVFVPGGEQGIGPATQAAKAPRASDGLKAAGAQGQNVIMRLAVRAYEALGPCELQLSDLKGTGGKIPASAIQGYLKNYRWGERGPGEMALLPTLGFNGERWLTQSLWLWLTVPEAAVGTYTGMFNLRTAKAGDTAIPVEVEVYPFKLRDDAPISYGMYGGREGKPAPPTGFWEGMAKRYAWMKKAGFTGTSLPVSGSARSANPETGAVRMVFNKDGLAALKASGLGKYPKQYQMTTQLGLARRVSRYLQPATDSAGAPVDKNPGIEFTHPSFRKCWFNAMKQWHEYLESLDIPYAIEIVDEPREVPNPWNRNYKDTCTYGDWMKEVGFTTRFVTPMSDGSGGVNYTKLAEHTDIVSIHAGSGSKGHVAATHRLNQDLWYYNTSKDRYGWGFFPWARGVTGRWEWHWMWSDVPSAGGYPGRESYSPFSGQNGYTLPASWKEHPGGFLFKTHMIRIAEGCTDRKYIHTLERLIQTRSNNAGLREAAALLDEIRKAAPEFPKGKPYYEGAKKADEWREAIARMIIGLQGE